jgi:hypothetical protein
VGLPRGRYACAVPPRLEAARRGPCHGIWIATTTFVPTFLAIVVGIPYLAGLAPATPSATPRPATRPTPPPIPFKATAPQRPEPAVTIDENWARGPASASQDSAKQFAAMVKDVGFPAHVRREDWRGIRWVVWIGNPD